MKFILSYNVVILLILSLSSCTKDMSNEKDTGEILDKTFYLFSRSTGGTDGYYTDTTSGTPQPVRYLKLYSNHYFKSQDVKVNKENGEYVLDLKDSIFSSIDTGEDSVAIINTSRPYEYKYGVSGYLQSETSIIIDEDTNIYGSGSSTIYSTGPSSTTAWYLSSNPNFFETTFIKELAASHQNTVSGVLHSGVEKIYTSSTDFYYKIDTINIVRKNLFVSFDSLNLNIKLDEFLDVKLPKEFVTFEDGNYTYFQDRDPGNIDPYVTSYIKSHITDVNGKREFYYINYYWNSLGEPKYKEIICNL